MYIRRTLTHRQAPDKAYTTYRLVESRREGERVRQVTLLNLGRYFDVEEALWPDLCARLSQLLSPQSRLLEIELPTQVEATAQRLAAQLIARAPTPAATGERTWVAVDPESMALTQPRSVGVEQVALHAWAELAMDDMLASLGINAITRGLILAQVVARMAAPSSELAAWTWLDETSALGELIDQVWAGTSIMSFYRAADGLIRHQTAIEAAIYGRVQDLFGLDNTVTLYDLTNTYFEGSAAGNRKAKRGRSKEKRSDRLWVPADPPLPLGEVG